MLTLAFWSLVPVAVGTFLLIAWVTDWTCRQIQSAYRRWACRREIHRTLADCVAHGRGWMRVSHSADGVIDIERLTLESLATAQDKRERRIVH